MTNLSELLPSGGGAKEFDAVASGTLPTGQTVVLKADGKVEAVGIVSQSIGSTQNWSGTDQVNSFLAGVYDDAQQRVIIAFTETSPSYYYGQLIAGEVDAANNSITFGTASIYNTTFGIGHTLGYDSVNNKAVVFFQDVNQSSAGKARVASISGSTITFPGSNATYNSGSTEDTRVAFSPTLGSFLVVFKDNANSAQPGGVVGTVSGNNISFGSETTLDNKNISYPAVMWDSTYNKYLFVYRNNSQTNTRYQYVSVSGTTVTAGSPNLITSNGSTSWQGMFNSLAYDSVNQKILYATINPQNNDYGSAFVATSDGSTLTFGTENFFAGNNTCYQLDMVWDSSAEKMVISYVGTSQYGYVVAGSVSGTTLTFGSSETFRSAITSQITNFYDSDAKRVVTAYTNQVAGDYTGNSVVFQAEASSKANFIGITSEAIANSATGKVNPQGGVATAQATSQSNSLGSAELFNAGTTNYSRVVYDSNSNRIVVIYADNSNSNYGTAIVGTVSGSSVSYGTEQVFNNGTASYMDITFDSNSNRVVIAFTGTPANEYGTAIVGQVDPSDNSISFGTAVVYKTSSCAWNTCTFDSSNNKIVVAYRPYPSPQGIARVGTVDPSDNSISFTGAESVYVNGDVANQSSTFDSSNNKVVITFQDGTNNSRGTAIVGTVSGTGISFGSKVDFSGANNTNYTLPVIFDSNSNKIVVLYSGAASTYIGRAKVGTISGTSISFGSEATFESGVVTHKNMAFDSTGNKVIVVYDLNDTDLKYVIGTVSGTDITFGTSAIFSTGNGVADGSLDVGFDSSANRSVFVFRDQSNSNQGTSQVLALAGISENLIVGSTYYVQNNGDLSTTSSSVTAGKAISTTQLVLKGAS